MASHMPVPALKIGMIEIDSVSTLPSVVVVGVLTSMLVTARLLVASYPR